MCSYSHFVYSALIPVPFCLTHSTPSILILPTVILLSLNSIHLLSFHLQYCDLTYSYYAYPCFTYFCPSSTCSHFAYSHFTTLFHMYPFCLLTLFHIYPFCLLPLHRTIPHLPILSTPTSPCYSTCTHFAYSYFTTLFHICTDLAYSHLTTLFHMYPFRHSHFTPHVHIYVYPFCLLPLHHIIPHVPILRTLAFHYRHVLLFASLAVAASYEVGGCAGAGGKGSRQ